MILTNFKPQHEIPKFISLANICINSFEINKITDSIIPIKILEYLACGKPVLSTPLKGTMDLLPKEDFGIIYSPYDSFVESLTDLLANTEKLEELGSKGLDYVIKNHDWDILADSLLKKFENLVFVNSIKKAFALTDRNLISALIYAIGSVKERT